jgi:hypothetical protein
MNISKEQFTKLAKEHLLALESYKIDKNGNKPIEIFGIEKLYEAIIDSVVLRSEQLPKKNCTLNIYTCGKGSGCKYPHCHI